MLRVSSVPRHGDVVPIAGAVPKRLLSGDPEVDVVGRTMALGGQPASLTVREFDLLVHLMIHPGQAFSRERLMKEVLGWEFGDASTVTVHVRRLREKVEKDPAHPVWLATVWGVGYRWENQ